MFCPVIKILQAVKLDTYCDWRRPVST